MAERTDELTRNGDEDEVSGDGVDAVDFDATDLGVDGSVGESSAFDTAFGVGETADESATAGTDASRLGRVRSRAGDVFSPASFAVQFVAALVGVFVVGDLVPVLPFAGFLGLFLMAGLSGTLSGEARYAEAAVAGGASGALSLLLGSMGLAVVTGGLLPVVGAAVGALAAVGGFYAGRDLRDGVTREL